MSNSKKVLVIGDACKDVFIYCDAPRLCPDVPVPVLNIKNRKENGGMAVNVQSNIKALFNNCDILTNSNWEAITKTRYVHDSSNHMFFRVDSEHDIDRINLTDIDLNYDIVVVSDYNKGFLEKEDIEFICKNHKNVFLDTKKILGPWARHARYIKINDYEYKNSLQHITNDLNKLIIHTSGAKGCFFRGENFPVEKVEVKDTSGAGDSFMAALVVKFLETEDIKKSINFANLRAAEVVKHRGVTLI